jgi:pimeloyl-ACP methyl ester carboxylesterase
LNPWLDCEQAEGSSRRPGASSLFSKEFVMVAVPTSRIFRSRTAEIAYLDEGSGDPIVLVHGFASNKEVNWVHPGWVATLTRAGRRVIALDNRGHGASTKRYDPADYHTDLMAGDVVALLDHLGVATADVMGYSMGARIAAFCAVLHPDRVRSVILGGLGLHLVEGAGLPQSIAFALEAYSLDEVTDPNGRTFRQFAEQTRSDLKALAACIRGSRQTLAPEDVARFRIPTLVAVGTYDRVAGSAQALAALIPGAKAVDIPGRDHMLAVGDRVFKAAVLEFLTARP